VTKRFSIIPNLNLVVWVCSKCGQKTIPLFCNADKPIEPTFCSTCNFRGRFQIYLSQTLYRNYQSLTIQEPLSSSQPGRIPRTKQVIIFSDLANC
jgi:DNA replication licensing factor MCM2